MHPALTKIIIVTVFLLLGSVCLAEDAPAQYSSVEQNVLAMDKNGDGVVTVYEVRAYIEARHGMDYEKDVLDEMESSASGKSCSTPFAQRLYH